MLLVGKREVVAIVQAPQVLPRVLRRISRCGLWIRIFILNFARVCA